jgi:hypothetical protein
MNLMPLRMNTFEAEELEKVNEYKHRSPINSTSFYPFIEFLFKSFVFFFYFLPNSLEESDL